MAKRNRQLALLPNWNTMVERIYSKLRTVAVHQRVCRDRCCVERHAVDVN